MVVLHKLDAVQVVRGLNIQLSQPRGPHSQVSQTFSPVQPNSVKMIRSERERFDTKFITIERHELGCNREHFVDPTIISWTPKVASKVMQFRANDFKVWLFAFGGVLSKSSEASE